MRGGPRLSPQEYQARTERMKQLLREGWTVGQIADHYILSPTRIYQLIGPVGRKNGWKDFQTGYSSSSQTQQNQR